MTHGDPEVAAAPAVVVIVDDDNFLSELLAERLASRAEPDLTCGGIALNPDDAKVLVTETQPDVILFDGVMFHNWWPDERRVEPIELAEELVRLSPLSHLLIWTQWSDSSPGRENEASLTVRAIRAGAEDIISKGKSLNVLLARIRAAVGRGAPRHALEGSSANPLFASLDEMIYRPSLTGDENGSAGRDSGLTPKQTEWARVIAQGWEAGMTIAEIARLRNNSIATVQTHRRNIYRTWGVRNQAQFVAEARRRGLL